MTTAPRSTLGVAPPRRGGMTLVEIILAIGIVVLMMGSVYAFYSGALDTRQRITDAAERISSVRAVMARITRELRGAMVFMAPRIEEEGVDVEGLAGDASQADVTDVADVAAGKATPANVTSVLSRLETIGVEGGTDHVEFATVGLPGPSAWAYSEATDSDTVIQAVADIELIGYRLRVEEDGAGNAIGIIGLERSRKKELIPSGPVEDADKDTEWVLVSRHIKFLRLRYWQGDATVASDAGGAEQAEPWSDGWGGGDMPKAIEVTLGFKPLPEDCEPEDYPYQMFRRMIYIPAAGKSIISTAGRGLGGGTRR